MPGEPKNWFAVIPGYKEAVERENLVRESAFLNIPESICGIPVKQLTPSHFIALEMMQSPFVVGGMPAPEDAVAFLWVVSPRYQAGKSFTNRIRQWRFGARCRKLNWVDTVAAIHEYLEDAFQDSPGSKGTKSQSYDWSWVAALIDQLASEYHWREADIAQMPFKRLFQYSRLITFRSNPDAIFFNRRDKLRGEWLRQVNKAN